MIPSLWLPESEGLIERDIRNSRVQDGWKWQDQSAFGGLTCKTPSQHTSTPLLRLEGEPPSKASSQTHRLCTRGIG